MIYVGIDDTDVLNSPGTNQLVKAMAAELASQYACAMIVRHQLLEDSRVPCTTRNGSASMLLEPRGDAALGPLIERLRAMLAERFVAGSDPGLCVTDAVPAAITAFARRCQHELVRQQDARRVAAEHGIHLEGLGGTEDGVIGALAAVGLVAEGDDGRVVQIGAWPDDLSGPQKIATLHARGVEVRCRASGRAIACGTVDVGKHLRPNYRRHKIVLFAVPGAEDSARAGCWDALRLT